MIRNYIQIERLQELSWFKTTFKIEQEWARIYLTHNSRGMTSCYLHFLFSQIKSKKGTKIYFNALFNYYQNKICS
jgi:hypothetical protein